MKIEWSGVPDKTRKAAEPDIKLLARLVLPTWVHLLYISFDFEAEKYASADVRLDYREATITISSDWVNLTPAKRAHVLRHEVAHIIVAPLAESIQHLLKLADSHRVRETVESMLNQREEEIVEDIARALRTVK